MTDRPRFDPVGGLVSLCLAVLLGAIALSVAVHLIHAIWPWLVGIALVAVGTGLTVRAFISWRRRQW